MARLLVHIATGPRTRPGRRSACSSPGPALEAGHSVDVFIAGDGVAIMPPETLDAGTASAPGACASTSTRSLPAARRSTCPGCRARPGRSVLTAWGARGDARPAGPPGRADPRGRPGPRPTDFRRGVFAGRSVEAAPERHDHRLDAGPVGQTNVSEPQATSASGSSGGSLVASSRSGVAKESSRRRARRSSGRPVGPASGGSSVGRSSNATSVSCRVGRRRAAGR